MASFHLLGVALCLFALMGSFDSVKARKLNLMSNLMKQADTLKHGLDLASQVGDIGSSSLNVAFTAVPSSSYSYSSGTTIKFSQLRTNIGNAFSTSNYRFTAPSSGLYVFHWSLSLSSSYYGNTNLKINGSTFHKTYCRKTYQQCGSTVTVWLSKSDQVWVESAYSSVYARAYYSSFSGWRLH
uniref:Caprin-2-like n=1 Tax=Crassostrea virginica TaxID=6565 RepID=A0A8B8AUF9_CRAVI|nr:caprin-2-like [Crassostrea virginica]